MSLNIKKSLELQRFVLGERPEVRNCRFDNDNISEEKLVAHSASTTASEVLVYPGTTGTGKKVLTSEQMIELQRRVIEDTRI